MKSRVSLRYFVTGCSFNWKNNLYSHPTVVAFVSTHVKKEADDYKFVASKLKDQAKENCLIYGSNGAFALEKSLEEILSIEDVVTGKTNIHLRWFDQRWLEKSFYQNTDQDDELLLRNGLPTKGV